MGRRHEKSALVRISEVAGNGASGCARVRLTLWLVSAHAEYFHNETRVMYLHYVNLEQLGTGKANPILDPLHICNICGMILAWFGGSDHSVCI